MRPVTITAGILDQQGDVVVSGGEVDLTPTAAVDFLEQGIVDDIPIIGGDVIIPVDRGVSRQCKRGCRGIITTVLRAGHRRIRTTLVDLECERGGAVQTGVIGQNHR